MTKLVKRPKRDGYYVQVSVPSNLRKVFKTGAIYKKAGKTLIEAKRNYAKTILEVEAKFKEKLNTDPLAQASKEIELRATHGETPDGTDQEVFSKTDLIEQSLKKAGFKQDAIDALFHYDLMKKQGLDPSEPDEKLKSRVKAALKQSKPYQDWIERRQRAELPKPSTLNGWHSKMKRLAEWFGSEYLSELTKDQAVSFKEYLFHEGIGHTTIKTYLGCLSGFWNWAKRNNQVQENIWEGLKVGLKDTKKKKPIPTDLITTAKERADHFQDIQFWIQYFTGCRKGEHAGLRWKDMDLMAGVIRIEEWEKGKWKRYLKCGEKDERTIAIHSKLMTKFVHYLPEEQRTTQTNRYGDQTTNQTPHPGDRTGLRTSKM